MYDGTYLGINLNSPIVSVTVQGRLFYIKRDDLIHPVFNGNKARKFHYYYCLHDPQIKAVVSFGGNQSNAMLSLSVLAALKGWRFEYYLHKLPLQLIDSPKGNFKSACNNGMIYHEVTEFPVLQSTNERLVIRQGGADSEAEFGITGLAKEINQWVIDRSMEDCCIFLPSGTGTTAFFLQQHTTLPVYTTPCVGSDDHLKKQWQSLSSSAVRFPTILLASRCPRFGSLALESLELWHNLLDVTGIEFDLLYDPVGWMVVLQHLDQLPRNIIYIHCGGTTGNESMLPRYNRWLNNTNNCATTPLLE